MDPTFILNAVGLDKNCAKAAETSSLRSHCMRDVLRLAGAWRALIFLHSRYMSYSLSSLKGVIEGIYIGDYYRGY